MLLLDIQIFVEQKLASLMILRVSLSIFGLIVILVVICTIAVHIIVIVDKVVL